MNKNNPNIKNIQKKKNVRKFLRKCMKNVIKMKKTGYLGLTNT